ncbi:hypothetical protein [Peribacillus sp. SCS-155]|uniref:hypothetical protein n=1 Tax=Peribacillus sedimenti TaxID=3115297 RepID=UPI003905B66C
MTRQRVLYMGNEYDLLHRYDSGYCEIRETHSYRIELVHTSDLLFLTDMSAG